MSLAAPEVVSVSDVDFSDIYKVIGKCEVGVTYSDISSMLNLNEYVSRLKYCEGRQTLARCSKVSTCMTVQEVRNSLEIK